MLSGKKSKAAAALIIVLLTGAAWKELSRTRFDAAVWQNAADIRAEPWPRLEMADDLLRRHLLEGITQDSLEAMLGPKPRTDYFPEHDYVYWLGPERGWIRIDSEWLVVDLDSTGRVAKAEIVRD